MTKIYTLKRFSATSSSKTYRLKRKTFGLGDGLGNAVNSVADTAGNVVNKTVDMAGNVVNTGVGAAEVAGGSVLKGVGNASKGFIGRTLGAAGGGIAGTMAGLALGGPLGLIAAPALGTIGAFLGRGIMKHGGQAVSDIGNSLKEAGQNRLDK